MLAGTCIITMADLVCENGLCKLSMLKLVKKIIIIQRTHLSNRQTDRQTDSQTIRQTGVWIVTIFWFYLKVRDLEPSHLITLPLAVIGFVLALKRHNYPLKILTVKLQR